MAFGFSTVEIERVKAIKSRGPSLYQDLVPLPRRFVDFSKSQKGLYAECFGEKAAEHFFGPGPWGKTAIAWAKKKRNNVSCV